ncbi:sesquipedalian-2 [Ciconia boyciana]|uniref:sesquipedalian-2 n=1 Tax=Ciconia boyciana TaxID=52775 RepID=UPI003BA34BDC
MKLNERSVAHYATCDSPADHAGFLRKRVERHHHHAHHHHATSYQRRWFVLKGNLLFYFEERESREPVGLVVLEGCTVELCEATEEFAFAIRFDDAGARAYVLVADGQAAMEAWVKALSRASFDYMRLVVRELEKQLEEACKSLAACHKSPRRSSSSGRKRHLSNPALLPLQEKPAILENGYSTWGSGGGVPGGAACPDRDGGHVKPPPLPPRRRSAASSATGSPAPGLSPAMPESPVSPETACFSKLHSWYGQEIAVLRREWQERQKRGHP